MNDAFFVRASDERRLALEETAIQRIRASAVRKTRVRTLGQSPPARVLLDWPYVMVDSVVTGAPLRLGGMDSMDWTTPEHEEIELNCEISSYANAEL